MGSLKITKPVFKFHSYEGSKWAKCRDKKNSPLLDEQISSNKRSLYKFKGSSLTKIKSSLYGFLRSSNSEVNGCKNVRLFVVVSLGYFLTCQQSI